MAAVGDLRAGLDRRRGGRADARGAGDTFTEARALHGRRRVPAVGGSAGPAIERLRAALELSWAHVFGTLADRCGRWLVLALVDAGRFDEAVESPSRCSPGPTTAAIRASAAASGPPWPSLWRQVGDVDRGAHPGHRSGGDGRRARRRRRCRGRSPPAPRPRRPRRRATPARVGPSNPRPSPSPWSRSPATSMPSGDRRRRRVAHLALARPGRARPGPGRRDARRSRRRHRGRGRGASCARAHRGPPGTAGRRPPRRRGPRRPGRRRRGGPAPNALATSTELESPFLVATTASIAARSLRELAPAFAADAADQASAAAERLRSSGTRGTVRSA